MKIVPFDNDNWKIDHSTGAIAFQHMLKGEPGTPENFMYILGRQDTDFYMPRHRHNFDQIRLPITGTMSHGDGIVLGEGEIAYIPEGLAYGPQEDPLAPYQAKERLQLVLQFGGASGYGFMSIEQRRKAKQELAEVGTLEGPYYRRSDGSRVWGLNAVWEQVFGTHIKYPRPRYRSIVISDPKCYNWLPLPGATGVERKFFGMFSERGVWTEMLRLKPGAVWSSDDAHARRLLVVLSGSGAVGDTSIERLTALDVVANESLTIAARSELQIFLIGLPPIVLPTQESSEYDFEELPPQAVLA
jgi:hypothetical protein